MSLPALRLYHGRTNGGAVPEGAAVAGATLPFGCLVRHGDGRDVHGHPNLRGGSLRASNPMREGQTAGRNGRFPALVGKAGHPDGQVVGQRVLQRLEAALDTLPGTDRWYGSDDVASTGRWRGQDRMWTVEMRASIRFSGSILQRQDIAFVLRKPESGGTPTPPGVEFVRYRRFRGLGFRPITPRTPRIARESSFPGSTKAKGPPSRPETRHGRILKPPPVTTKLPAGRSIEDHVGRIIGHDGAVLGRGDGVRSVEHAAARRFCGAAENLGVRGGAPPRQPPQGTHGVWPQGVCWLVALAASDTPWATCPRRVVGCRQYSGGAPHRRRSGEPVQTGLPERGRRRDGG